MTSANVCAASQDIDISTIELEDCDLESPQQRVVAYIATTLCHIVQDIQARPYRRPSITLKRIRDVKALVNPITLQVERQIVDREVTYCFPGRNKDEAWRFACVAKILADIYAAIKTGVTVTKRDLYYHDPSLYKQQATVDRYVDVIAYTCGATRQDLNVTASPKGLFAGLDLTHQNLGEDGVAFQAVPDCELSLEQSTLRHLRWILVVEKEATFRSLVEKGFHKSAVVGNGLLVTGKGYPDLATRRFLRRCLDCHCWVYLHRPPVFGLFDCDRDGIAIMQTYRQGSIALAHESSLTVPELKWLGLRLDDVVEGGMADETLMPLTTIDRERIRAMLARQSGETENLQRESCSELQRMLILNIKAEIQLLEDRPGGLVWWLEQRIGKELGFAVR